MASTESSSPPAEDAAQKQARIRRERREAKIKAGGSARLEKITNISGRPAPADLGKRFKVPFHTARTGLLPAIMI